MNMPWPRLRENKNILICSVQFLICFSWQWHWLGRLVLMSINIIPFSLSNNFHSFRLLVFPFLKTFHLGLFHIFAFDVMTLNFHICYLKSVLCHEKWCTSDEFLKRVFFIWFFKPVFETNHILPYWW